MIKGRELFIKIYQKNKKKRIRFINKKNKCIKFLRIFPATFNRIIFLKRFPTLIVTYRITQKFVEKKFVEVQR